MPGFHRVALLWLLAMADQADGAGMQVQTWGKSPDGNEVERVTVENDAGMRLAYINIGASLVAVEVPDRCGKRQNVLLSLPDLPAYLHTQRRFAAVMGRYAGRIGDASFPLENRVVELVPGRNGVTLHGGPDGYDRRYWQRRDFADRTSLGSVFHLVSPDGDQNFPGRLGIDVTYRLLRRKNEFRIEYTARTDAPTVLNLTNHAYFNLAGAGYSGLATHRFQINADRYAPTDFRRVPTGALEKVDGTVLDFRRSTDLASRLEASDMLGDPPGFDHSLLFSKAPGKFGLVAVIDETTSGRRMEIRTSEPSVQLNSGNGFDGSEIGSEGRAYQRYDGFAFETEHLPDSPNHANFPSTALYPGQTFHSLTSYRFSFSGHHPLRRILNRRISARR